MFKIVVAFFIVLGAVVWGQHYAGSWVIQRAAELPPQDVMPPSTVTFPSINSDQLRRSLNSTTFTPMYRH